VKPAPFAYCAPRRLDEALALLADDSGDREARILAGGQSLVPMMNFRLAVPELLVDIRHLDELRYIRIGDDGGLEVGAGTRQAELLRHPEVAVRWPPLAEALRHVGHPQTRSRGTVCGSLAHHDPTAELPAVAVATGARLTLARGGGRRIVAAEDFFVSYYAVALEPGEMVVSATFPALAPGTGWSFRELARTRGDFALVGGVCVVPGRYAAAVDPRLVLFGVSQRPLRVAAVEAELRRPDRGRPDFERIREAVAAAVEPVSDVHASAEYRRQAATELAVQCVEEAMGRRV
jgi:aerobic carbon-monoxide dehydrogenase medium subunit